MSSRLQLINGCTADTVILQIFATDPAQFVSITAHGGVIQSFLRAVNHRKVSVSTGSLIPVVVKAVEYVFQLA